MDRSSGIGDEMLHMHSVIQRALCQLNDAPKYEMIACHGTNGKRLPLPQWMVYPLSSVILHTTMRVVLQRVTEASVAIDGQLVGRIDSGLLVLLGIEEADDTTDADWLAQKICGLRIFSDDEGKMNRDLTETGGRLLVVSQFTLHAATKKGQRPSFIRAARPEKAIPLYEYFVQRCASVSNTIVETGRFGASMQVSLINDGPVTILIDSRQRE